MHVVRDPWLAIARDGQLPSWERWNENITHVHYFHSTSNFITQFVDRVVENLRWRKGRNASYAISYALMFLLFPFRATIPRAHSSNVRSSGLEANSLHMRIPETTTTMRWKKLSYLKYFVEESDSEYVIITNSSSILNFEPIYEFIRSIQNKNIPLYAGPIHTGFDCEFTSGSFTLLNRMAAEKLLDNRILIPLHVMDDIGFGTAFMKMGVKPINFSSLVIDSLEILETIPNSKLKSAAHFRIKSGSLHSRNDVEIAKRLLQRLDN